MATGRKFEDLQAKELLELKAILESYAALCGEMVEQLGGKTFRTDGYTTIKKGLFALRNLLAKQLGQLALEDHPVVATWTFRKESSKKTSTSETIRIDKAAEPPAVYDVVKDKKVAKRGKRHGDTA